MGGEQMDIGEFRADLMASIASRAEGLDQGWREAFVSEILERLREAGEIPEAEPCIEQIAGPRNRRLIVDAYALDDADDSLHLFAAVPDGTDTPPVLTLSEARDQGFAKLSAVYDAATSGWLTANIEESRPLWSIAEIARKARVSAVRLHIISDRPLSDRVKSIPDGHADDGTLVTYQVWDLTRLKRIHDASSVRDDLVVDLTFLPGGGLKALRATNGGDDYEAYLAVIPGESLAEVYTRYGSRLLEGNVRTFLGRRGNVNRGIQRTLDKEPSRFFAYNNGIAATASEVEVVEDGAGGACITSATDLQIVNGAQTTASLAAALRDKKLPMGCVYVPMKLSVVAPTVGEELIPLISKYANSQNAVRASDFFANHPFHRRVEEMSRRILAPATDGSQVQSHWYYERARGQYLNEQAALTPGQKAQFARMNPKNQVISKTDLAKVETCFALEPDTACRGAEKAFTAYAGAITDMWKDERKRSEITDDWFRAAVAKTIVFRATEKVVSGADWYEGGYRAQVVAYICARLAKLAADLSEGGRLDYRRIWNTQGCDLSFRQQIDAIGEVMMRVLRTPPREGQNIGEWAKQQACRETAMRSDVPVVADFRGWIIDALTARSESQETRATGRVDEDLRVMGQILSIRPDTWSSLREHARAARLILPSDEAALRAACSGRPLSEAQARRLVALLERAQESGWENPGKFSSDDPNQCSARAPG